LKRELLTGKKEDELYSGLVRKSCWFPNKSCKMRSIVPVSIGCCPKTGVSKQPGIRSFTKKLHDSDRCVSERKHRGGGGQNKTWRFWNTVCNFATFYIQQLLSYIFSPGFRIAWSTLCCQEKFYSFFILSDLFNTPVSYRTSHFSAKLIQKGQPPRQALRIAGLALPRLQCRESRRTPASQGTEARQRVTTGDRGSPGAGISRQRTSRPQGFPGWSPHTFFRARFRRFCHAWFLHPIFCRNSGQSRTWPPRSRT
jgi:hypothetical protein